MFENLQALAELAKAGYKPSDIKELLELNSLKAAPEDKQDKQDNDNKPDEKKKYELPDEDPLEAIIKRNEGES